MGWSQLRRTVISLGLVLLAYWLYGIFVVPRIEPTLVAPVRNETPSGEHASRVTERFQAELAGLFPDDAWENRSPKILRHRHSLLLFQRYEPQEDGTLRIVPCTVIYRSMRASGNASPSPRDSATLILQSPEGAILQLDRPIDVHGANIGQPIAGRLLGKIKITSHGGENDRGRFTLVTSNVQINEQRLWTPSEVDLQFDRSRARGRDLWIKLMPLRESKQEAAEQGWAGVRSVELIHLDELHMEAAMRDTAESQAKTGAPVDVACRGPLRINFLDNLMTFEDQVQLRRSDPSGVVDKLDCDRLFLYLARQEQAASGSAAQNPAPLETSSNKSSEVPKLEIQRVVAEGNPVILDAPSRHAQIRGHKLLYDLREGRYRVWAHPEDQAKQAWLRHLDREITARELDCEFTAPSNVRRLRAVGPGTLQGSVPGDNPQILNASWRQVLRLDREETGYRLALAKDADVQLGEEQRIQADMIYLWLTPDDSVRRDRSSPISLQVRPQRLLALADPDRPEQTLVRMRSESLRGITARLEVDFQYPAPEPSAPLAAADGAASPLSLTPAARADAIARQTLPVGRHLAPPARRSTDESRSTRATNVSSDAMHAILESLDGQFVLRDLELNEHVKIVQDASDATGDKSFQLTANSITMEPTSVAGKSVLVTRGEPILIESTEMRLETTRLYLDRDDNLVWTDQPGILNLLMDRDPTGQPLASPQPMTVRWQRGMDFDGKAVRFAGDVQSQSAEQRLTADLLEIHLERPIRIGERTNTDRMEVDFVQAEGNVQMEYDQQQEGELLSHTRLQVPMVRVHRRTGALRASGPGSVVTIRAGFRGGWDTPRGGTPTATAPTDPDAKAFLQVDYLGSIQGNLNDRIVHFHDRVHVIYGPVLSWNETLSPRGTLRKNDVLMSCQKLTVSQSAPARGAKATFDMQAQGNTYVEGQAFTARGDRVSFDQAKDMLVLEGTERTDAVLSHQARVGAPRSETVARKILYWRSTGRVHVDDARYLDLSNLGL